MDLFITVVKVYRIKFCDSVFLTCVTYVYEMMKQKVRSVVNESLTKLLPLYEFRDSRVTKSSYETELHKLTSHFELLTRRLNFCFSTFELLTRS